MKNKQIQTSKYSKYLFYDDRELFIFCFYQPFLFPIYPFLAVALSGTNNERHNSPQVPEGCSKEEN